MEIRITCDCGQTFFESEGCADAVITCACGRALHVPPYRRQQARLIHGPDRRFVDDFPEELLVVLVIGVYALGSVLLGGTLMWLAAAGIAGFGFVLAMVGYTWLIFLIAWECHPEALVWTFLVPFFTWYFAFKRWDIARWAFCCNAGGLLLYLPALFF